MSFCVEDDLGAVVSAVKPAGGIYTATSPIGGTYTVPGFQPVSLPGWTGGPVTYRVLSSGMASVCYPQNIGITTQTNCVYAQPVAAPKPQIVSAPLSPTLYPVKGSLPLPLGGASGDVFVPPNFAQMVAASHMTLTPSQVPSPAAPMSVDMGLPPIGSPGAPMAMPSGGASTSPDGNIVATIPPAGGSSGMLWLLVAGVGVWMLSRRKKG